MAADLFEVFVMEKSINFKRIIVYLLGQFILAMGISLSVKTDLGVSPVSSVPLIFSNVFNMELGNMTILVYVVYIFFQFLILRKDFGIVHLLGIPCAVIFGKFVTLTNYLLRSVILVSQMMRYLMLFVSIVLIAVGLKLYMWADIVPQAADGLVKVISDKYKIKFSTVKNGFDLTSVAVSLIVSLLFLKKIVGIREGTVIAALLVGRVAGIIEKWFGNKTKRYLGTAL